MNDNEIMTSTGKCIFCIAYGDFATREGLVKQGYGQILECECSKPIQVTSDDLDLALNRIEMRAIKIKKAELAKNN